ncbi:MAG: hypothetical protein JNK82_09360, partial [Myxococcaceae bacterium]|nr:hypothetical protein [Myxococcaceae bacterium]
MTTLGLALPLAAALVASSPSTLRRYAARERAGQPLVRCRGPGRQAPSAEHRDAGEQVVREMRGLIGADALSHRVPGLSRRVAAAVKAETLTALERERIESCTRISITVPGVVRGFDGVHISGGFVLPVADASVPYRTVVAVSESYDSPAVLSVLERDIALNGAPLVYRLDRAACHRTPEVKELCDAHQVLILYGPPRYPQYYGQLERQNREHRAWLNTCGPLALGELGEEVERMQYAWNCSLPRRSLGWRTASEVWSARPKLEVD